MKKPLMRVAVVALSTLTIASPAKAQDESFWFDSYCIMGSYQVCASVRLRSIDNVLTMQVWNLEGIVGYAHTMTSIGLYHSGTAWTGSVSSYDVFYNGSNMWGDPSKPLKDYWKTGDDDIWTLGGINLELAQGTSGNNGIAGCTELEGGTKWTTCFEGTNSFDGQPYMEFRFNVTQHFSLTDVELRWHSQQTGFDQEDSLKCDTGGAGDYPPCVAVPEPMTAVLVATGMAGVMGAARRRRKKGEVDLAA